MNNRSRTRNHSANDNAVTLSTRDAPGGKIYIYDNRGNSWLIEPHPHHGISIEPIGASLIPYCLAIAEHPNLCDLWTHKEGNRRNKP